MSKSIAQIQGTNDYSSVSKYSMVKAGYFEDQFIQYFVPKYCRRTPLINIGYYVRAQIIDFTFRKFLDYVNSRKSQIISCGAGFDTSFFRLLNIDVLQENVMYYEIDFPELIQKKCNIINRTSELSSCVGNATFTKEHKENVIFQYKQYCLIGCDLTNLELLEQCLQETKIDFSLPTLLLSECAITYMNESSSSALIQWAASQFENAMFATYEQIFPNDGFGIVMTQHFATLKTPLLSLKDFPSLESQKKRYLDRILNDLWILNVNEESCNISEVNSTSKEIWPSPRFSHSAVSYNNHEMVLTGGLGEDLQPLNDVLCFNCITNSWQQLKVAMLPRYGHKSVIFETWLLLIGGVNTLAGKQPGLCIINMVDYQCSEYTLPAQDPEKPILLHNHSAKIFPDQDTVTVFGGGGNCFSFGTAFNRSIIKFKLSELLPKT